MAGKLVPAVGGSPQFLCTWVFPEDCVSVLTTWWLAPPEQAIQEATTEAALHSHILSLLCYALGPMGQLWFIM